MVILVDPEDEWLLEELTWFIDDLGYVRSNMAHGAGQIGVWLHHFIVGHPIDGSVIDHENRDPSDNRRSNLRYASRSLNAINSHRSDTAKYIRVTYNDKYEVRITHNKVTHHIGTFGVYEDACAARDEALARFGRD